MMVVPEFDVKTAAVPQWTNRAEVIVDIRPGAVRLFEASNSRFLWKRNPTILHCTDATNKPPNQLS
jgi:hypothetical protein